jgi:pimeloyl-ACP methyl ester carboxylesterase
VTVAQRQVRVHGQHVTYPEAGVGRGPVVVLVHGLASSSTTWADVMSLLGRRATSSPPIYSATGTPRSRRTWTSMVRVPPKKS